MDKIVGRFLLLLLLCMHGTYATKLTLKATDMEGRQLQEVQAGEPFLLAITLTEIDGETQEPKLNGVQDFAVKRIGYRSTIINGDKSLQYTYQIRIDKVGTYVLGPAHDPVNKIRSSTVRIKVGAATPKSHAATAGPSRTKQQKGDSSFLRLWVDSDNVYVGQKMKIILRFYVPEGEQLSIEHVAGQDPERVTVTAKEGPAKGTQELEGKPYVYYEWQWQMFAQEAGSLVVPAYSLEYAKQLVQDPHLGAFAAFFSPRYERKRLYSNALTIEVKALPVTDHPVHAVGKFSHYHLSVEPAVAKQYDGIVLTLSVDGSGDMQSMSHPDLVLPDAFKWYSSKSYIDDLAVGQRKTFEYIVQGLKVGDWQIPEQLFYYFDVTTASYKKLTSASSFVTILPDNAPMPATTKKEKTSTQVAAVDEPGAHMLLQHDSQRSSEPMPQWLFILLLSIPAIVVSIYHVLTTHHWLSYHVTQEYRRVRAYADAKKSLDAVDAQMNVQSLQHIFLQFYALRKRMPLTMVSIDDIIRSIEQSQLSEVNKQQAASFFSYIAECAYAGTAVADRETIFDQARQWLLLCERIW